ncbi:hypothetical protein [Flavobacteriaceae bacterium 14752]|uniref:hypothetical protein n=1 Tax=Mesohalobacter salilacus TaxID=2491711 RepID=UPI000F642999|nr:hypothetical protein EIG84_01605 [Flavobacteriaceae bacterium 14752]
MKFTYFLLFILSFSQFTWSQTKVEVEKRIKKNEVPIEVLNWFKDAYEDISRVKWFYQTENDEVSYEAKLKHKKRKHSVEINPDGNIINIEVTVNFDDIESIAKQQIETYFKNTYSKFKIKKTQIQYLGSNDDLEDMIDENEMSEDITTNYEIEFYGKNKKGKELWEGLFDSKGELINRRKIKIKSTDILDY